MATIIGREQEQQELMRLYNSNNAEFVALYGRRRVGKTFLVRELFKDKMTFYHTGLSLYEDATPVTTTDQLKHFYHTLKLYDSDADHCPTDWMEAMYMLEELLEKKDDGSRQLVFIDELPWLDTNGSKILTALDAFWNGWAAGKDNVMLIVCGSAASWMIKNLKQNTGAFYGRLSDVIKLSPFTLYECELFLQSKGIVYNRYDICQAYMLLGGIPYYLNYFQRGKSLAQNIDLVLFDKKAKLKYEFKMLFRSLFKLPDNYVEIIRFLNSRHYGFSRTEIADRLNTKTGGKFSDVLLALEESDFIMSYRPFDAKRNETLYRLIDPFCRSYLYFIEKKNIKDSQYWQHNINTPGMNSWGGVAFEELCLQHIPQIKQALGIGAVITKEAPYTLRGDENHDGIQCDLIIERGDRVVNLCEMKYSQEPFAIQKTYDSVLRNRMSTLASFLKKTQSLQLTFITTFGVKQNMYSGIVQSEVCMEDLFLQVKN